jgi:BatD DUF11 like domain
VLYYNRAVEYEWILKYGLSIADCNKALGLKPDFDAAEDLKRKAEDPKSNTNSTSDKAIEPTFIASLSNQEAEVGQVVEINCSLNYEGINLWPPPIHVPVFKGFKVFSGPNRALNIKNGNETILATYILIAQKKGMFTFEPATDTINGNAIISNSLTLNVKNGIIPPNQLIRFHLTTR